MYFLLFKDGSTALFKAAYKGHNDVIQELLKFSPSLGLLKVKINYYFFTLGRLYCFVFLASKRIIFLRRGLYLDFFCLQNGSTVLHAAVIGGNHKTVRILLEANADPMLPNKVSRSK